jgi:hypothetical protein
MNQHVVIWCRFDLWWMTWLHGQMREVTCSRCVLRGLYWLSCLAVTLPL